MSARTPTALFFQAQKATHHTQKSLSEALGASERTGQRWARGGFPSYHLPDLARIVLPHDADLAAEIAQAAGATLQSLGLLRPPPAPPPPPPPPPPAPPAGIVDAVVCAAAEAIDLTPAAVRPAVLAAFARATELGLSLDFVQKTLTAGLQGGSGKGGKRLAGS